MSRARVMRITREVLLTTGAVIGALCIVLTAAALVLDVKPLMFRSGSMAPAINTGDLAFARTVDAADLKPGDVVSVVNAEGSRVTHRLVSAAEDGDVRQLKLKGDANETPDPEIYTVTQADKVLFDIPKAGYVVAFLSGPVGLFLLGGYAMFLLFVLFGGRGSGNAPDPTRPAEPVERDEHEDPPGFSRSGQRHAIGAVLTVVLLAGVASGGLLVARTSPTLAAFTDNVPVTGTSFGATTVPAVTNFTCTEQFIAVKLSWTAVPNATNYVVHYGSGSSQTRNVAAPATSTTITLGSGTAWVEAERDFGSVSWFSVASPSLGYQAGIIGNCL